MGKQADYANVLLALTTLASAPVAAYPESGAMMLAQQGQDRAVGKLADEAMKKAQKKAKKKSKVNAIASTAGTIGGFALGGPVGASIGGTLGNVATGGSVDPAALAASFAESKTGAEGAVVQDGLRKVPKTRRSKVSYSPYVYGQAEEK